MLVNEPNSLAMWVRHNYMGEVVYVICYFIEFTILNQTNKPLFCIKVPVFLAQLCASISLDLLYIKIALSIRCLYSEKKKVCDGRMLQTQL